MAKIPWKGGALLAPLPPVLVTTGTLEAPNVCTVAWCGMLSTKPPKTYISLRPTRLSHAMALAQESFVINLPTSALVRAIENITEQSLTVLQVKQLTAAARRDADGVGRRRDSRSRARAAVSGTA